MSGASADLSAGRVGEVALARLSGEVDASNAADLRRRIEGVAAGGRALVVDLSALAYMDSSGLALLDALRALTDLRVVAPAGCPARSVLDLVGLGLPVHEAEDDALAAAGRPRP